jgi:hypothetical protein
MQERAEAAPTRLSSPSGRTPEAGDQLKLRRRGRLGGASALARGLESSVRRVRALRLESFLLPKLRTSADLLLAKSAL